MLFAIFVTALASASELKVASYNIKHGVGMDGKLDLDRQASVLRSLNAELIALQEVDKICKRSGSVDQAKYLAEKLGMHYVFAAAIPLGAGEYGQAILTKHPINHSIVHRLPSSGEARIVIEVQVAHPIIGKLSFCSAHYSCGSEDKRMPQVVAFDAAIKNYKHPVILTGDYNAEPETQTMQYYAKHWTLVTKLGSSLTYPADKPKVEIDYCVLKRLNFSVAQSTVIKEANASDHRPLLTSIKHK